MPGFAKAQVRGSNGSDARKISLRGAPTPHQHRGAVRTHLVRQRLAAAALQSAPLALLADPVQKAMIAGPVRPRRLPLCYKPKDSNGTSPPIRLAGSRKSPAMRKQAVLGSPTNST